MSENRSSVKMLDVAKEAGVSRATVSLAMRESPRIPEATRQRVRDAAARLDYVYDRRAARLRSGTSNVIGLVITDNANLFFAEFAEAMEETLRGSDHVMLLGITHDDLDRQEAILRRLVEDHVAGIVLVPAIGTAPDQIAATVPSSIRLVIATRPLDGPEVGYVGTDGEVGGAHAAQHLLEHGCRTLAFFGGRAESSTRRTRAAGFSAAVTAVGATIDPFWDVGSQPGAQAAYDLAVELLEHTEPPDGIACNSDPIAYGLMRALADLGVEVGTRVRVIGFDDLPHSALWRPSLTSVRTDSRILGVWAAESVLGISQPPLGGRRRPGLTPRESCGCRLEPAVGSPD
jgi:LacI family transcriptional regulator